jgi:hypothetical protein
MMFKLFSRCDSCRRTRFYVSRRKLRTPIGLIATSKDFICGKCFPKNAKKILENPT